MRTLANIISAIDIVSFIRDTKSITYAGVVIEKRSMFCKNDINITLSRKNRPGWVFFRRTSLSLLVSLDGRRHIVITIYNLRIRWSSRLFASN